MDKILNLQISLFGSYINIQPQVVIVNRVTEKLKEVEMIPGIATVNTIDADTQQITTENRFKMESTDHAWQVVFFQERIDINYVYPGGDRYYKDLDELIQEAKKRCSLVFSAFPETTGSRIAVNAKILLDEMDTQTLQEFSKRFIVAPKFFNDRPISEMNVHLNSPVEIEINHTAEKCNYIVDIIDIVGIESKTKTIKKRNALGIDINTDKDNTIMKYTIKDILEFSDSVLPMMKIAIDEIVGEE